MKKKKSSNIFIWVFAAVALFLVVPFLFQEEETVNKGKLSIDQDGYLPVVSSENPLAKYIDRLTNFYGLKKKKSSAGKAALAKNNNNPYEQYAFVEEEASSPELNAEDKKDLSAKEEKLSAEDIAALRSAFEKNPDAFFAANTVTTKNGMELTPDSSGYTYKGKHYENGTYPDKKYKKEIENALNKYHTNLAKKLGLQPAYVRNSDGSLTVKYFDKETFDKEYQPILASSASLSDGGRYHNARIISRGAGYGGNREGSIYSGSSSGTAYRRYNKRNSFENIEDLYGSVSETVSGYNLKNEDKAVTRSSESVISNNNASKDILQSSSYVPLAAIKRADHSQNPNLMTDDYKNTAGVVLDNGAMSLNKFLNKYGITSKLEHMDVITARIGKVEDLRNEQLRNSEVSRIKEEINKKRNAENNKVRVFSVSELPPALQKEGNIPDTYVAFPRTPYVDFSNGKYNEIPTFSNVFLERTGIRNMFEAMGVSKDDMINLRKRYDALDTRRAKNTEYFKLMGENKQIQQKMPKVVYYLGKMHRDNFVAVASPSNYLYAYTPNMAPDFVIKNNVEDMAVERMTPEAFLNNVAAKGNNIVVVNDENVAAALKKSGVKSVVVISADNLYSGTPQAIDNVLDSLKGVIKEKILSDTSLKEDLTSQIKSMGKEIAEAEKDKKGSSSRI